jgi:hypothetical protein
VNLHRGTENPFRDCHVQSQVFLRVLRVLCGGELEDGAISSPPLP